MRRRARHRLIGAAVLVLAAVIGFPLLFDSQPRPVPVDVPINIPDRHRTPPLSVPGGDEPAAPAGTSGQVGAAASLDAKEEVVTASRSVSQASAQAKPVAAPRPQAEQKPESKPEPKPLPKAEPKPEPKAKPEPRPESKVEPKPAPPKAEPKPVPKAEAKPESPKPSARADDGDKARALLEGKELASAATAEAASRVVVQVGAFSDADKARETRQKLEQAGLKTFTQVVETKDGKRIRVRVGPFASKADADKAAGKIRKLDLPAAILTP